MVNMLGYDLKPGESMVMRHKVVPSPYYSEDTCRILISARVRDSEGKIVKVLFEDE